MTFAAWIVVVGLLLSGCATGGVSGFSSLGREVNVTPMRGQSVEQQRQDDRECEAWARMTKGKNEPFPSAEIRYAACALARGYRVAPWGASPNLLGMGRSPVSSPTDRTLDTVIAEMQRCGANQSQGYGLMDTWAGPAQRREASLACLEQHGYKVETSR